MLYQPVSQWHSLHFELLIEVVAQKLTELWRFKNWPIFWPGDLVQWPTYLSMSHTGTAHPFHMWTKFGDDMSKRSWVMLDKTDRLTDRQTDRQMKGQSEIAYLPKFANMMLIVMVIVITEILYIIIDLWLLWKSIGLHVLADDVNALYPSTPIRPVLWPGDLVIKPLTLKINRALYSAKMHLCMKFCEAISKHS